MKRSFLQDQITQITGCTNRSELEIWQIERVRLCAARARENSRFYHTLYRDIDLDSLASLRDLPLLPLTDADQFRKRPLDFLCCGQTKVSRVVTLKTSGTTSSPKRIYFSPDDQERTVAFFACGMQEAVSAGDRVMVLMPATQPGSVGDLLIKGLARIGVSSVPAGPVRDIRTSYQLLRETGCTCIVGIPIQVLALAQYGTMLPPEQRAQLKSVLLSADATPPALVAQVQRLLDCPVFTHFGMTEMGFGVAMECRALQGCHIREADILVEVIDPATGIPLPLGQTGEFVFTTLRQEAMPFLRYRTGDLGYLAPDLCPCGSFIRRMIPQGGRKISQIPLPDGQALTLWDTDQVLFACDGVTDYTLRLEEDTLHLSVSGLTPPNPEAIRSALFESPLAPLLSQYTLRINTGIVQGFQNGGMQKRSLASN